MKRFSILLSAFAALFYVSGVAHADTRAVYTISNIPVNETASTAQAAENQAFSTAQVQGLYRLMAKLTLPEDRAALDDSFYALSNARQLTAAVDVDDVRRSTTVYRANLSVVYNPNLIRNQLNARGVPFVDRQAQRSLLVPTAGSAAARNAWGRSWPEANNGALNQYSTSLSDYASNASWQALQAEASAAGARNAVIANLQGSEGAYSVQLYRESSAGRETIGTTGQVASLEEAVLAATAYLDAVWKRQSIVRGGDGQTETSATVRFSGLSSWNRLRSALANSPLVSGFQVRALARDGAVVSFTYAGDGDRLSRDLRQSGVVLSRNPGSWTMQLAGDSGF